jgi:hypothetical protein
MTFKKCPMFIGSLYQMIKNNGDPFIFLYKEAGDGSYSEIYRIIDRRPIYLILENPFMTKLHDPFGDQVSIYLVKVLDVERNKVEFIEETDIHNWFERLIK